MQAFILAAFVAWLVMTIAFFIAHYKKDLSIVDIFWGIGFVAIALSLLISHSTFSPRQILVTILVLVWGIRLALHIGLRKSKKGEDPRYTQLRTKLGDHLFIKSYFAIFMLQAFLMLIIALPIVLIDQSGQGNLSWLDLISVAVWIIGFFCESLADYQLSQFMNNPNNKGQIMTSGIWAYSRHPNYFGESVMWWALWLLALPVAWGWLGIISPVTITYLLVAVSGIPMLEKMFEHNSAYQEYKKRTSAFIPWFKSN